jgi:uncharacterized 2Fe-2S/4Fe-4S cluster protein (DUF4445 family)
MCNEFLRHHKTLWAHSTRRNINHRVFNTALRKGEWKITVALNKGNHDADYHLLDLWPGYHEGPLLGLAIDLGSTTIAAHLCDLTDGKVLASFKPTVAAANAAL